LSRRQRSGLTRVDIPETRYAVTEDGAHIAYQVVGKGPVDLIFVHSFVTHIELFWELASFEQLIRAVGSFARVILFDKRGVGLSDRLSSSLPTLEARMDELRAVLDAAGSERALDEPGRSPRAVPRSEKGGIDRGGGIL
jgi:pimeloyl-ACP methyl ester carboxylesterase